MPGRQEVRRSDDEKAAEERREAMKYEQHLKADMKEATPDMGVPKQPEIAPSKDK